MFNKEETTESTAETCLTRAVACV